MKLVKLPVGRHQVVTADQLDGYGYKHLEDVILNVVDMSGKKPVERILEWCSGPGYIAFALETIGYGKEYVLSDIHEPLIEVVNQSIIDNNVQDRMQFICSDNFKNMPAQKFDLIVGNPPHFNFFLPDSEEAIKYEEHRKHMDLDWECHKDFFKTVKEYLAEDGQIILMENVKGSSPTLFYEMLKDYGLRIANSKTSREWPEDIWYLKIVHAD
jgi:tRNA1(Val) A37 N6-methylase TrmN6